MTKLKMPKSTAYDAGHNRGYDDYLRDVRAPNLKGVSEKDHNLYLHGHFSGQIHAIFDWRLRDLSTSELLTLRDKLEEWLGIKRRSGKNHLPKAAPHD